MPILRILNGPLKGQVFTVGNKEIFIGGSPNNDIVVDDAETEPRHAAVFTVGEMCFIRDLKSSQGTFVNQVRIIEEMLYAGDKIKIGSINIAFEDTSTELKEPEKKIEYEDEEAEGQEEQSPVMEIDFGAQKKLKDKAEDYIPDLVFRNLEGIYQFTQELSQLKEREQLLQLMVKTISKTLQPDNVYIFLKDKQGDLLPRAIWEKEKTKIAPVSRGIIRRVLKGHKAVMTKDAAADVRFRENLSIVKRKVKGVICAPLMSRGQVVGVIYVGAGAAAQVFVTEDMEFVTTIACSSSSVLDNIRAHRRQSRLLMNMMRSLVTAMELALPQNRGHSMRVASYAGAIAREKSLTPQKVYLCQLGGYLHDIGKIATRAVVPDKELSYREHVSAGEKILEEMEGLEELLPAVKYHHECHDGSGFPEGLKEDNIPLIARIVGLANFLDHLLTDAGERPLDMNDAIKEIKDVAGIKFHPDDVMALREAHRKGHLKIADVWAKDKKQDESSGQ